MKDEASAPPKFFLASRTVWIAILGLVLVPLLKKFGIEFSDADTQGVADTIVKLMTLVGVVWARAKARAPLHFGSGVAPVLLLFTAIMLAFGGCSAMQRQALWSDAKAVLGKVAAAELTALVEGQLDGDSAHAAAAAAWSAVDVSDIAALINDATNHAAPAVAQTAARLAKKAVTGGASQADARDAVAAAISAAAGGMK